MRNALLLFALAALLCSAGDLTAQGSAGQAGEFLRFGVGAKALGLGRAFTSVADDASAPYWNPAGLSALSRSGGSFMFMYLPLREGASFNYLAGGIPLRLFFMKSTSTNPFLDVVQNLNIGIGFVWHSLGDFQLFDEGGQPAASSQTSISQSALYVSLSYPLHHILSGMSARGFLSWASFLRGDLDLGLTTKFVRQDLFGDGGSAASLDLGFKYSHHSGIFNLGLTVRDLNQATISYDSGVAGDEIPANGVLGISLRPPFGRLSGLLLAFDYGVITPAQRKRDVMFGLEYDLSVWRANLPFKLRLGANSNQEIVTFGINFSPETVWGRDWLPSADWTYANDRSAFDATGARFSFSVDHNPFTARYWYDKAAAAQTKIDCSNLDAPPEGEQILRYLRNAQQAKNPGNRAYRYEAALRLADLEFLFAVGAMRKSRDFAASHNQHSAKSFHHICALYLNHAHKMLMEDLGKSMVDTSAYTRSFSIFLQSLILSGKYEAATMMSADSGRAWGKRWNVLSQRAGNHTTETADRVNYLRAFALYMNNFHDSALEVISNQLNHFNLARYLKAHILFLHGSYRDVAAELKNVDLNQGRFPADLFLPLTNDCTFGDEILFLQAASLYKMSRPEDAMNFISEFAKIPRFFPDSDMARFLTNEPSLLASLIDHYQNGDTEKLTALLEKMIDSYLKAFSNGTLQEESYTLNFK